MFNRLRILLLPASTIGADAEHDVSTFKACCGKDLVARVDDAVVAAETAMIAFAIFIKP